MKKPKVEDVEVAVETFHKTMIVARADVMDKLCSDKLIYGHSSGLVQNKEEFIDDLVNGSFDFKSITTPEQTITLSGNTAVVRHIFQASAIHEGEPVEIRIGNLQVYQLSDNGKWLLLARQAYKL
ncbi:nuclear transport factor 2 family protein [Flagellimonas sp.]|uniref:nuclear transport factor 2 family protein n=1 Tax=Flagellimonas sp. TaxID=2058762 RepID=UPI003BB0C59D